MNLPLLKQTIISNSNQHPLVSVLNALEQDSYSIALRKVQLARTLRQTRFRFPPHPSASFRQNYNVTLSRNGQTESLSLFVIPSNANLLFTRAATPISFQFTLSTDLAPHIDASFASNTRTLILWLRTQPSPRHVQIQPPYFASNLKLLDSRLDEIVSWMLWHAFLDPAAKHLSTICDALVEKNPLGFDLSAGQPFYTNKLKRVLIAAVTGELISHPNSIAHSPVQLACFSEPNQMQVFDHYQIPALLTYLMSRLRLYPSVLHVGASEREFHITLGMQLRTRAL